jgi:DNA modification methylase
MTIKYKYLSIVYWTIMGTTSVRFQILRKAIENVLKENGKLVLFDVRSLIIYAFAE